MNLSYLDIGYNSFLNRERVPADDGSQFMSSLDFGLSMEGVPAGIITSGEIAGEQLTVSGSDAVIQSSNFVTGSTGWNMGGGGDAEFANLTLTGGTIKYGKTSFSDSTNAGYIFNSSGSYIGAASDATYIKYTLGTGALAIKAAITIDSGSGIANLSDAGALATLDDIASAQIQSNAVTNLKIASDAVTAAKINVAGLNGSTGNVSANHITANMLQTDCVTADKIYAGSVTADKMTVSELSAISANIGTVTAGTITGATIQTEAAAGAGIKLTSGGLAAFAGEWFSFYTGGPTKRGSIITTTTSFQISSHSATLVLNGNTGDVILNGPSIRPNVDDASDLGDTTHEWKDLFIDGTAQVDALRIDQTPAAETPAATHTITISANGTNYKLLCVAA